MILIFIIKLLYTYTYVCTYIAQGGRRSQPHSETSTRLMYERRPLKSASLSPPNFVISSHILLESYVEKEVRVSKLCREEVHSVFVSSLKEIHQCVLTFNLRINARVHPTDLTQLDRIRSDMYPLQAKENNYCEIIFFQN